MLMKNTIIGLRCFLMAAGTFLRFTDGSEGKKPNSQRRDSTE